jgi:LPXTG-motif cell wall-anchored protein
MKIVKTVFVMFALSLFGASFAPGARADEWNRKTKVTFSEPVEVPGVGAQTLPAGTYVFKIMDSQSDRHIVQIMNEAEDHVFTTILAIPNYRMKATDKTVITFSERAAGSPEAIREWFYPGRQWGEEFVYPKSRAIELAKVSNQPVLATSIELTPDVPIATLKEAPIVAVRPTGEEVAVTEVVQAAPAQSTVAAAEPIQELPKTASSMPLLGLVGLLSLAASFALWVILKRTA